MGAVLSSGSTDAAATDEKGLPKSLLKALAQFAAVALTMWALLFWRDPTENLIYVWPLTGIQLAMILGDWRSPRDRLLRLVAGSAGMVAAGLLLKMPPALMASFAVVNFGEIWLAGTFLAPFVSRFDHLKQQKNVVRFCLVAICAPAAVGLLLAAPLAPLTRGSRLETALTTSLGDSVGIAVVTPAVLFLIGGGLRRQRQVQSNLKIGVPAAVVCVAITWLVFSQTANPFLFLVFPAMVVTLFLFGLEGAVFVTVTVTAIACWQTSRGQGPIWVMHDVTMFHRVLVLQTFLWVVAAVTMPVGALLDERSAAERSARESQSVYNTLLRNCDDMIVLSTLDGKRRFVSAGVEPVTGWTEEEYLALKPMAGIHPDDRSLARSVIESFAQGKTTQTFRYRAMRKDGGYRWVEAIARGYSAPESDAIVGYVATVRDISSLKSQEERWVSEKAALADQNETLSDLAGTDELTRIANRRTFNRTIEYEAARHRRSGQAMSVMMIDVDHFKLYNDIYGHPAGDECLQKLARTLQAAAARAEDSVARIGGEEFAVILPGTDRSGAGTVAEDILQSVRSLNLPHLGSPHGIVTVSIGIATWPPFFVSEVAELMQQADRALYEAKRLGRNGIAVSMAFAGRVMADDGGQRG